MVMRPKYKEGYKISEKCVDGFVSFKSYYRFANGSKEYISLPRRSGNEQNVFTSIDDAKEAIRRHIKAKEELEKNNWEKIHDYEP